MKHLFLTTIMLTILLTTSCSQEKNYNYYTGQGPEAMGEPITSPVNIHVIYDNYVYKKGTQADWGFSILIEGLDKCILFDTGTKPEIFEANFKEMGLDASEIDEVFISHEHRDHFGGLEAMLKMNPDVKVVVPETFGKNFFRIPEQTGSLTELVSKPVQICRGLYTTGVLGRAIPEQSMVLNTGKGLVVMTGCSHPGIINILEQVEEDFGKDIYMVFGGFHLMNSSEKQINEIIERMNELGVQKCGASHCTGEQQIKWFRQAFGENFVELGTGNVITIL
ncbi:MAG: MBL fold metallo-hydrolase [Bacteroidota bacterium]|nr:MBL fold metallo-hydrolase [Bacteroidota bacterium]